MKTRYINSIIIFVLLLMVSCVDQVMQNSDVKENPYSITPSNRCVHNLTMYRGGAAAAVVVDAPDGTVYECQAGEAHEARGGESIYPEHWIDNSDGNTFALQVTGPNDFILESSANINIADPVNIQFLNSSGNWEEVTENCSVFTNKIRVNEGGSAVVYSNNKTIVESGHGDNT